MQVGELHRAPLGFPGEAAYVRLVVEDFRLRGVGLFLTAQDEFDDDEDDAVAACMRRHVFLMAIAWPITAPWLFIRAARAFFRDYRETVAQEEAKRAKALVKAAARAMREADEALRRAGEQK